MGTAPVHAPRAYCDSKLANLLFTYELPRRLSAAGSPARALAAHPGISATNLAGDSGGLPGRLLKRLIALLAQDAEGGARPTLFAATEPLGPWTYVGPGGPLELRGAPKPVAGSRVSRDSELGRRLWERSAELTRVDVLPTAV